MNKYRVYIKKPKKNIIYDPVFKEGTINSNGEYSTVQWHSSYSTPDLIKINANRKYKFVSILSDSSLPSSDVYIIQFDVNGSYLRGRNISYDFQLNEYIPENDVGYIKLQFGHYNNYKSHIMFLESTVPVLIHDSSSPDKKDHLVDANLHLEDSSAGSFDFVLWRDHPYYSIGISLWIDTFYITRTYRDGSERICWDGRAITEQIDASGNKTYHCEGAIAYLNDVRTIENAKRNANLTVSQFVNELLIGKVNTETSVNRMDRSFYYSYSNGQYNEGITSFIEVGIPYLWNTNHESCLKWISDIKESFGAHFKVRYRPYDSPKNDIICRCFTIIQDFDMKTKIFRFYTPESGNSYILKKNTLIASPFGQGAIKIRRLNDDITVSSSTTWRATIVPSSTDVTDSFNFFVENSDVYINLNKDRIPYIKAKFGENVFDVNKLTEIKQFATIIIPRGCECKDAYGESYNVFLNTTGAMFDNPAYNDYHPATRQNEKGWKKFEGTSGKYRTYADEYIQDYALTKQYGYVEAIVDFKSADTPLILHDMATKWFIDLRKELFNRTIEMSLVDLNQSIQCNSGDPLSDPEYIDIWTRIEATIPTFGITENNPEIYYVMSLDIPLDNYLNTSVTFSNKNMLISENAIQSGDIKGTTDGIIDTSGAA